MSYYYPRAAVQLRLLPEDYQLATPATADATIVNVQARNVTVHRNDYRTADTFDLEIDYKSFPFDPRTVRALGVVIYMQDMQSQVDDDGNENKIVPGEPTDLNPNISNAVFLGFADEEEINFDESGRKVTLKGRDSTSLLIDQKYNVPGPFYANTSLDKAILSLTSKVPALANIIVVAPIGTNGKPAPLPNLMAQVPGFGDKLAGGMNTGGGKRETYWDIILECADRAGLICYMGIGRNSSGDIVPAIYLSTPVNQSLLIDPNTGQKRTDVVDDIKIIYGQNVKNLRFKRKLGRLKGFNITLISRNGKNVTTATVPREANQDWCDAYGIAKADVTIPNLKPDGTVDTVTQNKPAPALTFPVTGIGAKADLILMAQTVFEQYSLQQLEGSFETYEMLGRGTTRDSNVDNKQSFTKFDMTQIKKGQTVCIEIDPFDLDGISRLTSTAARVNYLIQRNYSREVAGVFANSLGKMSPRFKIKNYSMTINQDSGFKLEVEFYNILDISNRTLS